VGRALLRALAPRARVLALSRAAPPGAGEDSGARGVTWRRCDLFSLSATEEALAGAEVAFYLVHSMLPAARLVQGRFEDLDLLLADNFGRAAARVGVRRIVYLGGLVSDDVAGGAALSAHLRSRLEVERALAAHGVPVTAVRAGLVVGSGGSSLEILVKLVRRLPVMVCPRWTRTLSQPIALEDVVAILVRCAEDAETAGRVCEVGGPDVLSYRDMMAETARLLGVRRLFLRAPLMSPGLSRLWVTLVTGAPRDLVAPLVESLRHPMVASDRWLQTRMGRPGTPFAGALAESLRSEPLARPPTAFSVQRLPLPPGWDANDVASAYAAWLPRRLHPFLAVDYDGARCTIRARGIATPLLRLDHRPESSGPDRAVFEVVDGLLAGPRAGSPRLEFRVAPDGKHVLAAVQDFRPRLPWWIYLATQARGHAWVMHGFGRHLGRRARRSAEPKLISR
jgi:uncharacterized protein YbjT (DUF2867 family)